MAALKKKAVAPELALLSVSKGSADTRPLKINEGMG
jgi:hypothetical protein